MHLIRCHFIFAKRFFNLRSCFHLTKNVWLFHSIIFFFSACFSFFILHSSFFYLLSSFNFPLSSFFLLSAGATSFSGTVTTYILQSAYNATQPIRDMNTVVLYNEYELHIYGVCMGPTVWYALNTPYRCSICILRTTSSSRVSACTLTHLHLVLYAILS